MTKYDTLDPKLMESLKKNDRYSEGISIITPTGDRHLCMKQCAKYIERQTYNGPLQWIIADDGLVSINPRSLSLSLDITHIDRKNIADPTKSFIGNLRDAIQVVKYSKVLIFEDDDYYSPDYIQIYNQRLDNYDLVGEAPARYYNVRQRVFRQWGNDDRASFCQTGLKSAKVLHVLYLCTSFQSPFVDYRLWQKTSVKKFIFMDDFHCVGLKGMPGRRGIGSGHRPNGKFKKDPQMKQLEKWIGKEDADFYRSIKF